MAKIVIIGNSAAGFNACRTLINNSKTNEITVICQEQYPAYRKNLLVEYLEGSQKEEDLFLCGEEFYEKNSINLQKNSEVLKVDTKKQFIALKDKAKITYDYLIIASGQRADVADIPGKNKDGVFAVNNLSDIKKIKDKLIVSNTICIIGDQEHCSRLEQAITAKDKEVKVISKESGLMPKELIGEGQLQALKLSNGKVIGTSLVLFVGNYIASTDFLTETDIATLNGYIVTDESMRTNLANVFACGSVAKKEGPVEKEKLWEDACNEGILAAKSLIDLIARGEIACQKF